MEAIKARDPQRFLYTIEFFPEEGKYHLDGHRACGVSLLPEESKAMNNICPKCGAAMTIGVLNRIQELAVESAGYKPEGAVPYKSLVPLAEIIGDVLGVAPESTRTKAEYELLVKAFGSEFSVILGPALEELEKVTLPEIARGIINSRNGDVELVAGYDGVFGHVKVAGNLKMPGQTEKSDPVDQKKIF
jgi:PHP family Zn ribbon phosphoesterase